MENASNTSSPSQFSGIWRSDYTYHSSDLNENRLSQHYVRMYPKGNELIIESVPEVNESYMLARFSVDNNVATGSWQEVTDPKGDYNGTVYHGAGQLIVADDAKSMKGKWVGFGKNMEVKTGPWEFVYIGEDLSSIDLNQKLVTQ